LYPDATYLLSRARTGVFSGRVSAYTVGDVARICGVSRRRVRYWERTSLISSTPETAEQPAFDFRDLVSVRSIVGLLERGVPLRRIRLGADVLRERCPERDPLAGLRTWGDAPRLLLHHDGSWMETDGQLVLDFVCGAGVAAAPVQALAPRRSGEESFHAARDWFVRGSELDGERETWNEAAECYRRAIALDPTFADAHCNLGSLLFNRGRRDDARRHFERTVELAPRHVEGHLNLGTLCEEDGADERALWHYRQALESDPRFPDIHVSIALIYEKLELNRTARVHWRRYLALEPAGSWSRVARQRLDETS
jgi:DNA-binding transcriptional MerR regulator